MTPLVAMQKLCVCHVAFVLTSWCLTCRLPFSFWQGMHREQSAQKDLQGQHLNHDKLEAFQATFIAINTMDAHSEHKGQQQRMTIPPVGCMCQL